MICPECHKNRANIHFKGIINENPVELDLCDHCAKHYGITFADFGLQFGGTEDVNPVFPSAPPLIQDLLKLLSSAPGARQKPKRTTSCPNCHWTFSRFRKEGKLGCPNCYVHFESQLTPVLTKIQGTASHKGYRPQFSPDVKTPPRSKIEIRSDLQKDLERAVKSENYEKAALLRDQLRKLDEPQ